MVHRRAKSCWVEVTWHVKDTDIFMLLYRYLTESYGSGQDIDDRIVEGIAFSLIELKVPMVGLVFLAVLVLVCFFYGQIGNVSQQ